MAVEAGKTEVWSRAKKNIWLGPDNELENNWFKEFSGLLGTYPRYPQC